MKTVYLAGPIAGKSYTDATDWREHAAFRLAEYGVATLSPMRAKQHLAKVGAFTNQGYEDNPLTSQRGIVTRDRNDVRTSDLVLMNLLGANKSSVGSAVELGWADAWRVPVVTVLDINDKENPMTHAFVKELGGIIVPDLEQAILAVVSVLDVVALGTYEDLLRTVGARPGYAKG